MIIHVSVLDCKLLQGVSTYQMHLGVFVLRSVQYNEAVAVPVKSGGDSENHRIIGNCPCQFCYSVPSFRMAMDELSEI